MKVRWRQHEFILITIFAVIAACTYVSRLFTQGDFSENVKFYKDILLLEFITLIIQYGCYIWLNKFIIPRLYIPKQKWNNSISVLFNGKSVSSRAIVLTALKCLWLLLQFIVII